tara:strand:- start:5515 stop:7251 length:1737 start_codon:yes stop_codon:yes gene_type:complete
MTTVEEMQNYIDIYCKIDKVKVNVENHIPKEKLFNDKLTILKNEKNIRSTVYSPNGEILSFAPLSSCKDDDVFFDKNKKVLENVIIQEYIEGTMINLFNYNNEWIISTKGNIGGNNKFFRDNTRISKSFKQMFDEVLKSLNIDYGVFNKLYSYSFVMKHVDNRIINPILKNELYLINCYDTLKYTSFPEFIYMIFPKEHFHSLIQAGIKLPVIVPYGNSYYDKLKLIDLFGSPKTAYNVMGINLLDTSSGKRTKIRNPNYEELKRLRGNQAKMEYHYIELRNKDRIKEFLDFFPEYDEEFMFYEIKITDFCDSLYNNYIDCYLKKKAPLKEFSPKFRNFMYKIHEKYQNDKIKTTYDIVANYLTIIPEAVLMSAINYDYRQHNNNPTINNENSENSTDTEYEAELTNVNSVDDLSGELTNVDSVHDLSGELTNVDSVDDLSGDLSEELHNKKKRKHHGGVKHGKGKHGRIHHMKHNSNDNVETETSNSDDYNDAMSRLIHHMKYDSNDNVETETSNSNDGNDAMSRVLSGEDGISRLLSEQRRQIQNRVSTVLFEEYTTNFAKDYIEQVKKSEPWNYK